MDLVQKLLQALPAASFVAILIFVVSQLIELRRKHKARARAKKMIQALLGEEYRQNWAAFNIGYDVIHFLESLKDCDMEDFEYKIHKSGTGVNHCTVRYQQRQIMCPLKKMETKTYEKLVEKIAELDEELFQTIHRAHLKSVQFNNAIRSITAVLDENGAPFEQMFFCSIVANYSHEKESIATALQGAHKALCGSEMDFRYGQVVTNA